MNQKNDFNNNESLLFEEEVHEDELVDKKNQNDVVYIDSNNNGNKFLIFLIILLISMAIFCFILGALFSSGKFGVLDSSIVKEYDLYVTHTNADYGASNLIFDDYDSDNDTYDYVFDVTNSNSIGIDYSVEFNNVNYGNDGIDMNLINYSLYKNDEIVSSGTLEDIEKYIISTSTIDGNSRDSYVLKLWSNAISKELKFSFKINVIV